MAKEIEKLRKKIDKIDKEIIDLLFERLKTATIILEKKRKLNLPLTDLKREELIIQKLKSQSKNLYLEDLISEIYPLIFNLGKKKIVFEEEKKLPFNKIGILGLGLIGGSIAKAIKIKKPKTKIFTLFRKNDKDIVLAQRQNYLDKVFKKFDNFLNEIELLIIATPIEAIIPLANKIAKGSVQKSLIVIDVGSIKEKIVNEFEKITTKKIDFLGTHPMAGSEKQGFLYSSPLLFLNHQWVITPHSQNKKENIKKAESLVNFLGAKVIKVSAKDHDLKVAYSSHLIFLISRFLFAFGEKKKVLSFTGSGFQSLTRLASSNPKMHFEIFKNNEKNIKKALKEFLKFLETSPTDSKKIKKFFLSTKKKRDDFYKKRNNFV